MEERNSRYCKVCVTGGSSYIGSSIIKKLLGRGTYIVHATLRNLGDVSKVGLLKSLPGAETRLKLFEADIYKPEQFEAAIQDCQYVVHVATPFVHVQNSQYKDTTEAAVAAVSSIAMTCIQSGTVRRLVYTASVTAASPLKDDGSGFKDFMDESCWTPPNLSLRFIRDHEMDYTISKTLSEKEVLKFGNTGDGRVFEVVSLTCGLVGGEALLSYAPLSMLTILSQLMEDENTNRQLSFLEELLGRVPVVHIEDICDAHIFCMEQDSINGRFLCASDYVSRKEIAEYYKLNYPEFNIKQECMEGPKNSVKWGSTKLMDKGFKYNYDMKHILDDSVKYARRLGLL